MNINSNHNLLAFGREIDNSRTWLQARIFSVCGYSSEILLDRLTQRLIEIGLQPYAAFVKEPCMNAANCFPAHGTRINCGRASMQAGTGRVSISLGQLFANQWDFLLHWFFCLGAIIFTGRINGNKQPAVLVFGVGRESLFVNESDEQFVTYCRLGPITPLRNGKRFFVQSVSKNISSCQSDFFYSRDPLIDRLRDARLGICGRLHLLAKHIILFFAYMSAIFRLPQLSLLGRDFAYSAISFDLDRRDLIEAIILTAFHSQPLWIRGLRRSTTHLVWYSQSFRPIIFASDKLESVIPSARWIRVDTHWVWTHAFAQYLGALVGNTNFEIVGPIVWQMPIINVPAKSLIEIVIFDNPPFSDEVALDSGEITNYWHPDNLFSFIKNVISLKAELEKVFHLPVSFHLKTKRGYNAAYDRSYFDFIEMLGSQGVISLEHHSVNIYSLISRGHLVIVYPFSSPAYIADYLKVPSIYYDPTQSIVGQNFGDPQSLIAFASSQEELLSAAVSALSKAFSNNAMTPDSAVVKT